MKNSHTFNRVERDFIVDALNAYWNMAKDKQINSDHLGDREKINLQEIVDKSKKLMVKLDSSLF